MELFLLPKEIRCHIVSLLLSAVKVDKDSGEVSLKEKLEYEYANVLNKFVTILLSVFQCTLVAWIM